MLLDFSIGSARAAAPARIDFYPADVHLTSARGRQRFLVVATRADGVTEEVTAKARVAPADPKRVRLDGSTIFPLADGQTTLAVGYEGLSLSIPVTVKGAKSERPVSFQLDVMPIFMRGGCNTGACHGSARGKDGFHLSLFGYDPAGDYYAVTRELGFRRINLAVPTESLLLQKAIGAVPHSGGKRFEPTTDYYATLLRWLEASVPSDAGEVPKVEVVELYPPQMVLEGAGTKQPMGLRVQCAQCHNHPFDRWTMDDYYRFASFFARIGRKPAEDYREIIVFNRGEGTVNHPVGGRAMEPKFLGGPKPNVAGKDRRAVLAEWLTSPENPFFAPSVANRIWTHFFGIGIVEPVDDVRVSNPASNPELVQALGAKLISYRYDFKQLVRDICHSQTYQRSTRRNPTNEHDERNFAHGRIRRIQGEMLQDCISQVTQTKDKFQGLPLGAHAVQIADGTASSYFLTTFGRSPRETVCAAEVRTEPTLSQALHLLNGDTIQEKIAAGGAVKQLLAAGKPPEEIIRTLYIRCLSREPDAEETAKLLKAVEGDPNRQRALEDVFWALLNSREFVFNH